MSTPSQPSVDREIGQITGELKALSTSMAAVWTKLNEMSQYAHQRNHDIVDQTAANAAGILLINQRLDAQSQRIDALADEIKPLAKLATRGEGAWWAVLKIGGLLTVISAAFGGAAALVSRLFPGS